MTYQPATVPDDLKTLPKLPGWVTSGLAETLETVAFRSGAASTVLDQLVSNGRYGVPVKLLANRLALSSASATSKLEGRLAREADICDAYQLTPPGEARGPDGDLLAFWRESARLRAGGTGESPTSLARTLRARWVCGWTPGKGAPELMGRWRAAWPSCVPFSKSTTGRNGSPACFRTLS